VRVRLVAVPVRVPQAAEVLVISLECETCGARIDRVELLVEIDWRCACGAIHLEGVAAGGRGAGGVVAIKGGTCAGCVTIDGRVLQTNGG